MRGRLRIDGSTTLWYGLGEACEKLGMYKEARDAFERASSLLKLTNPVGIPEKLP
jgi:uncharacterized protein HemY